MKIASPTGKLGEDIASEFLKKKGYTILERNYRKLYAELDIIALCPDKTILVCIEVKARTSNQFGDPLESITYWKLKPLIKAFMEYQISHPNLPKQLRIDAIGLILDEKGKVVNFDHRESISGF